MGMNALEVRRRVLLAQPHEAVASGAIASFVTDVKSPLPMEFDLEPIQSGSGDPSPENIRPITGHDGFTRTGTGKNLFDGEVYKRAFVAQSATTANIQGNGFWRSIYARVEGGKTYTISRTTIETNSFRMVATVDEPTIGEDAVILSNSADNDSLYAVTVTIPDGYNYLFVYLSNQNTTVTPGNYQIELGSHATTIVPYQGQSYTTTFPTPPGTVYGCHVKDNGDGTGTLVVTHEIVDLGSLSWNYIDLNLKRFVASLTGVKRSTSGVIPNIYCTIFKPETYNNVFSNAVDNSISIHNNQDQVAIYDSSYTDKDTFESAMVGQKLVYELATPIEYTLSLTALQSLIGQNHVWVDNADEVSVEYWGH